MLDSDYERLEHGQFHLQEFLSVNVLHLFRLMKKMSLNANDSFFNSVRRLINVSDGYLSALLHFPMNPFKMLPSYRKTETIFPELENILTAELHELKPPRGTQIGSCAELFLCCVFTQACCSTIKVTSRPAEASVSGNASAGCTRGVPSSSTICTAPLRAR